LTCRNRHILAVNALGNVGGRDARRSECQAGYRGYRAVVRNRLTFDQFGVIAVVEVKNAAFTDE